MTKKLTHNLPGFTRYIMWLSVSGLCAAVLSLAGIFLYLDPQIPTSESYRNVRLETPLRIFSSEGALIAEYGERRVIPITLDQVPQQFINALLDTEDKRFYQHSGIDFISLANDMVNLVGTLITEGELGPGASTITMQLARNVSFSLERRFLRKFKEMLLALKIEQELSKKEILELYMNVVPFGKRAYGAQAAALTYYGKELNDLTLAQLAMLAGLPQAPSAGNPINGPQRAVARRNVVLSRMLAQRSITQAEYDEARNAPITAKVYARELDVPSPYAAEWVRQQGAVLVDDLYTGGYEINTTINANMQASAIDALRKGLITYDKQHGYREVEAQVEPELLAQLESHAALALEMQNPQEAEGQTPAAEESQENLTAASPSQAATPTIQDFYPNDVRLATNETLRNMVSYGGLEPAVVVAVADELAVAQRQDGGWVKLTLQDNTWARAYIEVDLRGPALTSLTQALKVGDVIRVHKPDDTWLLAQLPEVQGALVALDPKDGAVRSLVGGFDFFANQYNHALQAARQPGSGFKPFVYSSALNAGVTPASVFMDAPLVFDDDNLESQYRPGNDNNRYNGPTRLRQALYRSINLVSIRVLLEVSAGNVLEYVPNFGFRTNTFPRNTQLAIGGGTMAVTPIDMARAYTVFANGGYLVDPYIVTSLKTNHGEVLYEASPAVIPSAIDTISPQLNEPDTAEPISLDDLFSDNDTPIPSNGDSLTDNPNLAPQVIDERIAFIMNSMLQDVIKRGTGRRARSIRRDDLAGKTGTTNDAADTWFNGYSPQLTTSVWVGFSNHAPLGARAYGSNTPLPIWIDFMEDALKDLPQVTLDQPTGITTLKVDPKTGEAAEPNQNNAIFEYFLSEFAPQPKTTNSSQDNDNSVNAVDLF